MLRACSGVRPMPPMGNTVFNARWVGRRGVCVARSGQLSNQMIIDLQSFNELPDWHDDRWVCVLIKQCVHL